MPQLVKGGKHAYGWVEVGADGAVVLPPDVVADYGLTGEREVAVLPGSATSGGFSVVTAEALASSPLDGHEVWRSVLAHGRVRVPTEALAELGIRAGDLLLAVRGSGLGPAFAARGRIVDEARRHEGLPVFGAVSREDTAR